MHTFSIDPDRVAAIRKTWHTTQGAQVFMEKSLERALSTYRRIESQLSDLRSSAQFGPDAPDRLRQLEARLRHYDGVVRSMNADIAEMAAIGRVFSDLSGHADNLVLEGTR